jgi:hypothetical protein
MTLLQPTITQVTIQKTAAKNLAYDSTNHSVRMAAQERQASVQSFCFLTIGFGHRNEVMVASNI